MTDVLIRDAAYADLESIWLKGAERWGIDHAVAYETAMFDLFDLLAANPLMSRARNRAEPPLRVHPFRAHLILYQALPDDNGIEVVRVVHRHADLRRLS